MPFFKFGRSKSKHSAGQKSSSMGSLYKDYSGDQDNARAQQDVAKTVYKSSSERRISFDEPNMRELQRQIDVLQQENNLLKLKVEVLLDMLAQKTAEAELQENDILKMKNILANS